MELLLNLAWLLLALPAFWLWRGSRSSSRKFTALQCLLALGCMLVVLFPVVSATDDLRAMRSETEESPVSKRTLRTSAHDKASHSHSSPALVSTTNYLLVKERGGQLNLMQCSFVVAARATERPSRAPPSTPFA